MDLSELKNITKHLLTDNELFSHLFTFQFTHTFVIVCFEVFQREIHGTVPFCKLVRYISIAYGNGGGDRDSYIRRWMGAGMISKLVAGIEVVMGIRVAETVGDGYKYLSPCSSLTAVISSRQNVISRAVRLTHVTSISCKQICVGNRRRHFAIHGRIRPLATLRTTRYI